MLYTSGTSGNPKGVPLTHKNVGVNGQDWLKSNAPLLDDERRRSALAADEPHLRLRRGLPGQRAGLDHVHVRAQQGAAPTCPEVQPTVFMSVPAVWEKLAMSAMQESDAEKQRAALQRRPPAARCASASRAARASSAR